jgi:alcohol dehydrogenase
MGIYSIYARTYQIILRGASYFLPWRVPKILENVEQVGSELIERNFQHVLVVTDRQLFQLGLIQPLLTNLKEAGIVYELYQDTVENPTVENVEEARTLYERQGCQAIIAFGGGSPMDCAKGVAARLARPKKQLTQLKGLLKVHKCTPLLLAIPTTAGTGSEVTIAAVITDSQTQAKYALTDPSLVPQIAVLDPRLTLTVPPKVTAATGVDALSHAVEAYVGRSNTNQTKAKSLLAVELIDKWLKLAYQNGQELQARKEMQMAAFYAGQAFTRAYVGYTHALAHSLGALYHIPHGEAIAAIMPYVLTSYGKKATQPLSELAELVGAPSEWDEQHKAKYFIQYLRVLNEELGLANQLVKIETADIPELARRAAREANPFYPVPRILNESELAEILMQVKEGHLL